MATEKQSETRDVTHVARGRIIFSTLAALFALVGLAESIYLTVQALTGETLLCGGSPDCFKVLGSAYAHLGPVPLASLGALAYFSVLSFATFSAFGYARSETFFRITVWLMFAMTLWLLFVQAFLLHAFCRYCLFSAALIFLLTGLVVATPGQGTRS